MTTSTLPANFSPAKVVASGVEADVEWFTYAAPVYGAINGYVRIPYGHPWSGKHYEDIDVEVHGGLTFASGDWIGFDTLHGGDYWPGVPYSFDGDIRWTAAMVAEEAKALARWVAAAA